MKRNYQKELDGIIRGLEEEGRAPELMLHSCCAPCSSYVFEYLSRHFRITDYFYNPNITDEKEYHKRAEEIRRLIREQPHPHGIRLIEGPYEPDRFFRMAKGLERCPEGGERCARCFALRLDETARAASGETREDGARRYEYIATTLTISPLKNADLLNQIGEQAAARYGLKWLPSDFKKRGGYQRSIELSREYGLYRQNYCGCVFSRRERDERAQEESATAPERRNLTGNAGNAPKETDNGSSPDK